MQKLWFLNEAFTLWPSVDESMALNVVFLCAGYGTRLEKDILNCSEEDNSKELLGLPKALLPIDGKALITHWIDVLDETKAVDHYFLVTNSKFYNQFVSLSEEYGKRLSILNDDTTCNEDRMGAVSSINFAIKKFGLNSDVLVIGSDTLMYSDFVVGEFLTEFHRRKLDARLCCLVTTYQCKDEDTIKRGILEVDDQSMKVKGFLEKPQPSETLSRSACPCFYMFSSSCFALIERFLEEKKNADMKERDATGNLIKFLTGKCDIYAYPISGRFDVGGLQSYKDCNSYFSSHRTKLSTGN